MQCKFKMQTKLEEKSEWRLVLVIFKSSELFFIFN